MMMPSGCILIKKFAWYGVVWYGWQGRTHQQHKGAYVKCIICLAKGVVVPLSFPEGEKIRLV